MNALFNRHEVDPLEAETEIADYSGHAEPRVTIIRKARDLAARIYVAMSHPDDVTLKRKPLSQFDQAQIEVNREAAKYLLTVIVWPLLVIGLVYGALVVAECIAAGWQS